jgi:hypothetical protein
MLFIRRYEMKRLIVLTISLLLGLAPMGHTADVAMDALTDGTATVVSTWYLVGYNSTTPYRFTLAGALGRYTGSLGATGAGKVTKGWFIDAEFTNYPTVNGAAVFDQDVSADANPSFGTLNLVSANSLNLGTAGSAVGGIRFKNATSGYVEVLPPTGALGTGAITLPASGSLAAGTATSATTFATPGASGNVMKSDGTNWTSSNSISLSALDMTSGTSSIPWTVTTSAGAQTADGQAHWESDTDVLSIGDGATRISLDFTAGATYAFPGATSTIQSTTGTPAGFVIAGQQAGDILVATNATTWERKAKGANNSFFGVSNAGVLGYNTTLSLDDSAAQFYSATASKGTWKMLMTSMGDGILGTFTPVCTGTCVFTNNTVGAGTYKYGLLEVAGTWSGQQTFVAPVLGAATGTSLMATGRVDGTVGMLESTADAALTVSVATHGHSSYFMNKGNSAANSIVTLPTAESGLQYCSKNYTGITQVLTLQTSAAGQYIDLDGTLTATGGFIHSDGAAGDGVCVIGVNATTWVAYPSKGTWNRD